jgi:hypothetical protein
MRLINIVAVMVLVTVAGLWLHAQGRQAPAPTPPQIISGADFGFRVDSVAPDGTPTGKIVVRQNGQWIEVRLTVSARRADVR